MFLGICDGLWCCVINPSLFVWKYLMRGINASKVDTNYFCQREQPALTTKSKLTATSKENLNKSDEENPHKIIRARDSYLHLHPDTLCGPILRKNVSRYNEHYYLTVLDGKKSQKNRVRCHWQSVFLDHFL